MLFVGHRFNEKISLFTEMELENALVTSSGDEDEKSNGGDIGMFKILWNGEFIKFGKWLHRSRPDFIYDNPKILLQRIRNPKLKRRLVATLDKEKYISSDGLSNILLKEEYYEKMYMLDK